MIQATTKKEVLDIVNSHEFVNVVWHSTLCPVCEQFMMQVEDIDSEFVNVSVNDDTYEDFKLFEPGVLPTSFIFKNGQRVFVPQGYAPRDRIENLLSNIVDGTFKTPREIEDEQLAALD